VPLEKIMLSRDRSSPSAAVDWLPTGSRAKFVMAGIAGLLAGTGLGIALGYVFGH
jgi:hypothetical protein